ncbi:MAG: putative bifunctional diguanylate cyclase/phosphodiesterase [Pseudomonadota bacterium]
MRTRSIRSRLLYSLVMAAGLVALVSLPLSNWLIGREFDAFVADKAEGEATRLELLLQERFGRLRANAIDYADWGSTAEYIEGANPTYLEENLYPAVLRNFDADFVFIVDRNASIRYLAGTPEYARQQDDSALHPLPPELIAPILNAPKVRTLLQRADGAGVLLRLDGRWHLVGASSVSHPGGPANRPVYGIMGFVSELDDARIARIRALAGVPFALAPTNPRGNHLHRIDGDMVMHRTLRDESGTPLAGLDIRYPQPLAEQIATTRRQMLLLILGIFLIGAATIWLLVERTVISRLERAHADLERIAEGTLQAMPVRSRPDEVDNLASGINQLHDELRRTNAAWRHEALHDALTGLGNRSQLLSRLESALATRGRCIGLMLIDLDGFKTVNDLFGHAVGDQVLRSVAERLRDSLPDDARCFRLGGDEFAVMTVGHELPGVKALAHTLNATVRADDSIGPAHALLSASIGMVVLSPDDRSLSSGELLQRADIALYSIKRRTRNGFAVFDDSMMEAMQRYNLTLRLLREALQAAKIQVWFQPILSAADGRVLSFEALARWHDARLGDVPPMRFVAIAEENSLGSALDRVVLEKAVAGLLELRTIAPEVALSVNASVQSLLDPAYIHLVPQVLARAGLGGDALRLEITESAMAANEDILSRQLELLRGGDVRIELDDFGTGHSSLGRLAKLQPRGIKLDRSFVRHRREGGDRVCRAIIGLAQELDVDVIAEGIETEEDAEFLRAAGCDALQGYLFSTPRPLEEIKIWLRERIANRREDAGRA